MELEQNHSYKELEDRYLNLDQLINEYDAEGNGPLRKGKEPFRWSQVEVEAKFLLERIPDIRLAIFLIRALTLQKGLSGMVEGFKSLVNVLSAPREEIRPFSEFNENPVAVHAICLGWLGSEEFLALIRLANLCQDVNLSVGDALSSASGGDVLLPEQREKAIGMLEALRGDLLAIRSWVSDVGDFWNRDPITSIDFISNLIKVLSLREKGDEESEDNLLENHHAVMGGMSVEGVVGINNRKDLKKSIDLMIEYFEKYEPSHPGPIFLQRVRRMVDASFEQVLEEFYADAPSLIEKIKNPFPKNS